MRTSRAVVSDLAAQADRMNRELSAIRRVLRRPLDAEVARGDLTLPQSAVMRVVVREELAHCGVAARLPVAALHDQRGIRRDVMPHKGVQIAGAARMASGNILETGKMGDAAMAKGE